MPTLVGNRFPSRKPSGFLNPSHTGLVTAEIEPYVSRNLLSTKTQRRLSRGDWTPVATVTPVRVEGGGGMCSSHFQVGRLHAGRSGDDEADGEYGGRILLAQCFGQAGSPVARIVIPSVDHPVGVRVIFPSLYARRRPRFSRGPQCQLAGCSCSF